MNHPLGITRDAIKANYALRTPSGFVPSILPGWSGAVCIVQISPAMGARFSQFQITLQHGAEGRGNTGATEYFVYLMEGDCTLTLSGKKHCLTSGSYVYLPPETAFYFFDATNETQLLIFQKAFQSLEGNAPPAVVIDDEKNVQGQPFLGDQDARLQVLLPDEPAFDMAVNIFTYQPGAALPFVETHIMEHGLVMLAGQGVYRLGDDWHPVQTGDVIWMAPYCPQWFVAMGKTPARYIYYKDVNRPPQ
jgi:(S)-ureidoglycine aminohydrolase